jgi:MYXO-CTERM domain-containing protein
MSRRIPGAQVTVSGGGTATARAGDAYWSLSLPAGAYTVTASASGYRSASRTCSLSAGAEAWCSIGLLPESSGGGGDTGGGGGDMGSQPGGGDTGGGGGDMGSQPGGGDTGEGGDTGGGGHGGFDPNAPRGRVKGYVVELNEVFDDLEACDGPRIGGAQVSAETGEQTTADGAGYFEFEVLAGEHLLGAKAAGYADGAAECSVLEGGEVECCIHLIPGLGGEQPPEDDPSVVVISCATSPAGSQAVGLVGLLLAGAWLVVRRRRA